MAHKLDVTSEPQVSEFVGTVMARYGRIDILVNNVGESIIKELFDTSLEEWNTIMTLNITSMFLLCREVGRHMREARAGKIINISSVLGMRSCWREYTTPW